MLRTSTNVWKVFLFAFALTCASMLAGFSAACAQECSIGIVKQADGAGDLVFDFVTHSSGGYGEFTLTDGAGTGGPFWDTPFTIRELPITGWVLSHVNCVSQGLSITDIQDGVSIVCLTPSGTGTCTFVNVPPLSRTSLR